MDKVFSYVDYLGNPREISVRQWGTNSQRYKETGWTDNFILIKPKPGSEEYKKRVEYLNDLKRKKDKFYHEVVVPERERYERERPERERQERERQERKEREDRERKEREDRERKEREEQERRERYERERPERERKEREAQKRKEKRAREIGKRKIENKNLKVWKEEKGINSLMSQNITDLRKIARERAVKEPNLLRKKKLVSAIITNVKTGVSKDTNTVRQMREEAKSIGVKNICTLNKKELSEAMTKEQSKKPQIVFTNMSTKEEFKYPSIYRAAKEMGISTSQVSYNIGKTKTINGVEYSISKRVYINT